MARANHWFPEYDCGAGVVNDRLKFSGHQSVNARSFIALYMRAFGDRA
jgi:hypothetical protein